MWHYDLMWHYKMRYMMKQVFLVILLAFGFVAGAQNVTVHKPKKQRVENSGKPRPKPRPKSGGENSEKLRSKEFNSNPKPHSKPTEAAGYDVTFTCNVPSALLSIDGVSNGTASGTRFLKTGMHSIQVTADNYVDYSGTFTVNSSSRSVSINLQEVPGYDVTFSCNVPSALLSIDGVPNGTASGTRFLKTGNHSIKVMADNYVDYTGTFAVNSSSRSVSVNLQEVPGYDVTFSCNVPSALLSIDGVPNGTASGTRFLKTGNHSIKVMADNYVDYTGTFAVNSSSRSVSITLERTFYVPNVKTFYANGVSFKMVEVRGGTFRMGATSEQGDDIAGFELPVHSVTLSGYYIGKTEVTQALWKAVMGSNPSKFKGDNLPVERVSWDDCQEFIRKLNALTGQNFRLPTEAEWEFACRGGNNSRGYKYSGSNNIDNVAWYRDNCRRKTHPVAMRVINELGIYDMSGNVGEWCSDWEGDYSSGAQTNPKGPYDGSRRVWRGGSWCNDAWFSRSSFRFGSSPGERSIFFGLRLAL